MKADGGINIDVTTLLKKHTGARKNLIIHLSNLESNEINLRANTLEAFNGSETCSCVTYFGFPLYTWLIFISIIIIIYTKKPGLSGSLPFHKEPFLLAINEYSSISMQNHIYHYYIFMRPQCYPVIYEAQYRKSLTTVRSGNRRAHGWC